METRDDYEDRMREQYSDVIGSLVARGFDTDIALQGGGCLAIRIECGKEWFALITDEDEPLVGQPRPHGWCVGLYGMEPDTGFCRDDYTGTHGYTLYCDKDPDVAKMMDAVVPLLLRVAAGDLAFAPVVQGADRKLDAPTFDVGTRVRLKRDVERFPHFIARKGTTGTVVVKDDRLIAVRMDVRIAGADEWDNEVWWYDNGPDADERLDFADDVETLKVTD